MNNITIKVPATPEIEKLIAALLNQDGVQVTGRSVETPAAFLTLKQGAEMAKVNYFTFRRWVVEDGLIPFSRPSGANQGQMRVKRKDIEKWLSGDLGKKKPGRAARRVTAI